MRHLIRQEILQTNSRKIWQKIAEGDELQQTQRFALRVNKLIGVTKRLQCHVIFDIFCVKDSTWAPYKQEKTV